MEPPKSHKKKSKGSADIIDKGVSLMKMYDSCTVTLRIFFYVYIYFGVGGESWFVYVILLNCKYLLTTRRKGKVSVGYRELC